MRPSLKLLPAILVLGLAIAGCNDNSSPQAQPDASSLPEPQSPSADQTPDVDADPTPDTGTGGESQTTSPDGTVNSAPSGQ
jgi:hypothetical protein